VGLASGDGIPLAGRCTAAFTGIGIWQFIKGAPTAGECATIAGVFIAAPGVCLMARPPKAAGRPGNGD
jgi:hypothetical protein